MKRILCFLLTLVLTLSTASVIFCFNTSGVAALTPTVVYTAGDCSETGYEHFNTVDLALVKANENNRKWKADDVLEIRFDGTFVAGGHNGILFSSTTIWREDNTKLPIIIRGTDEGRAAMIKTAWNDYCATNDYYFTNLTMQGGLQGKPVKFYAGSGKMDVYVNGELVDDDHSNIGEGMSR